MVDAALSEVYAWLNREPDPSGAWLAAILWQWPDGHMVQLAKLIVGELVDPPIMAFEITPGVRRRMIQQVHVIDVGLNILLGRLEQKQMLVPLRQPESYALLVPKAFTERVFQS